MSMKESFSEQDLVRRPGIFSSEQTETLARATAVVDSKPERPRASR
jgi:hypothetical protein